MRLFIGRGPTPLTEAEIKRFGIQSHPNALQSSTYQDWLVMCQQGQLSELHTAMVTYLNGSQSIKSLDDLQAPWSNVVGQFLKLGHHLTATDLENLERQVDTSTTQFETNYTAVADTLLALAHLKALSHPLNLDYQSILKVLAILKWVQTHDPSPVDEFPLSFLNLPVIIPICFKKKDACHQGQVTTPGTFSHLDVLNGGGQLSTPPGCVDSNCSCAENPECLEQETCCADLRLYLIDLMLVKDYTQCFKPGDLSYIKNVLAGETLSTTYREMETVEETTETEETVTTTSEKHLEVNDETKLHAEIDLLLKDELKQEGKVEAKGEFGKELTGKFTLTTTSSFTDTLTRSITNKETRDFARKVVSKATKKVESEVRRKHVVITTREKEETNVHEFNNSSGNANVNGQYFYVDKVSRAQVYNYGKKAVMEFFLPEPAALYNHFWKVTFTGNVVAKPVQPQIVLSDITPATFEALVAQYGINDAPPPPEYTVDVVTQFQGEPGDPPGQNNGSGSYIQSIPITIPTHYVSTSMDLQIVQLNYNQNMGVSISIVFASGSVYDIHNGAQVLSATLPPVEGINPAVLHAWDVTEYTLLLTVHCDLKNEFKVAWQTEIFNLIMEKYAADLAAYAAYIQEKADFEAAELEKRMERNARNPLLNREIEHRELKRMAISYLSCQFYDQFDAMKSKVKPCGYPEMSLPEAQAEAFFIQFFEHAFDWTFMSYIFYPYFWGRKCTWKDKVQDESGDFIFNKFLTAGSVRVLVPVRDAYYDHVAYFITTGDIWGGSNTPPLPSDPHYVSLAQEMKEQRGNYYTDRLGTLDVTQASNVLTLNNNTDYWDFIGNVVNTVAINADLDREIIIDFVIYRIVGIVENTSVTNHTSWFITLDRNFTGATATNLMWSTGAVYIGSPWEYTTPTNLVFLRPQSSCLPCYPLPECTTT